MRSIELDRLPPVLNVQLLRFVFDRKLGRKKKLLTFIEFGETLDMSKYLNQKPGTSSSARPRFRGFTCSQVLLLTGTTIYNLTAVLIHRGPSAFSGHYIAHIKTMPSAQWFRFNDELIEKLSDKKQLGVEDQDEGLPITSPL